MTDHEWEGVPNPGRDVWEDEFTGPDGELVHIRLDISFVCVDMTGLRRCRRCGQED